MRFGWVLALLLVCAGVRAQPLLDPAAVPGLDAAGRALYADFLLANTPRVAAIGARGQIGWYSGGKSLEVARARAVALCTEHGGVECRPYAENLSIVWSGREWQPPPSAAPFADTFNYGLVPDARFLWHGPAAARGVVVWSHGTSGSADSPSDSRGLQPPSFLRLFNNSGFDIVRMDRAPMVDNPVRAAGWLREGLTMMRRTGYRLVVAGGQSRGGWTSLQILDTAGLADVVIATSPAAHSSGASTNLTAQNDDLRAMVAEAQPSRTRVAFVQFANDPFMSDGDTRIGLMQRLRPKLGALLLVDRPAGLSGHIADSSETFSRRFAACLLHFTIDPTPPGSCPDKP